MRLQGDTTASCASEAQSEVVLALQCHLSISLQSYSKIYNRSYQDLSCCIAPACCETSCKELMS